MRFSFKIGGGSVRDSERGRSLVRFRCARRAVRFREEWFDLKWGYEDEGQYAT